MEKITLELSQEEMQQLKYFVGDFSVDKLRKHYDNGILTKNVYALSRGLQKVYIQIRGRLDGMSQDEIDTIEAQTMIENLLQEGIADE